MNEQISYELGKYVSNIQSIHLTDVVEIIIISFLVYHIMVWIKNTKAWSLLRGVLFILIFLLIARVWEMNTILWIAQGIFNIAATALIVVLQPELRKALEQLGKKNIVSMILPFDNSKADEGLFSDETIHEIARACMEMGKVRTGALIVVRQKDSLAEYEHTGIQVDAIVTSQLLINIFEHNTPLHDGAIVISGDRITYATCYLPLSDNMELSKDLGTRHRAGVGISEATDSMTVIVSEETGKISVAYGGKLQRGLSVPELEEQLRIIQNKPAAEEKKERKIWKGRVRNEK